MSDERIPAGSPRTLQPEVQALISMFAAAVLMVVVALVVIAVLGLPPTRLRLAGPTWQWQSTTLGSGEIPLAPPDPEAYTVRFAKDGTFEAVADCNRAAGTYSVLAGGRAGGALSHLAISPGPTTLVACGPESLSATFLEQLEEARRYSTDGRLLTIELPSRGSMVFEGADAPAD